jgi:hypothetical protein
MCLRRSLHREAVYEELGNLDSVGSLVWFALVDWDVTLQ